MRVLPLAVLVLLVAGCASPPQAAQPTATPGGTAPAATNATLPWSLDDCFFAYATVLVPESALVSHLPAGFATRTSGVATLGFELDICKSGASAAGASPDMTYFSVWTPVTPPSNMTQTGVGGYFINFDTLVPDAPRRALLSNAGAPVHDGKLAWDAGAPLGWAVKLTLADVGDFSWSVAAANVTPASPARGVFAQWTQGKGTPVFWRTDWTADVSRTDPGTLAMPASTWYAQAAGGSQLRVPITYGHWSYTNGTIVVPSRQA